MKKTYIIPELEVVKIQTTQMLAGSLGGASTPTVSFGDAITGGSEDEAE